MRSWLFYIPAGLIEVHPHMKYQLATINRSWDSTLDKNLNLVHARTYVHTHVRKTQTLYAPGGPRPRGHTKNDFVISQNRGFYSKIAPRIIQHILIWDELLLDNDCLVVYLCSWTKYTGHKQVYRPSQMHLHIMFSLRFVLFIAVKTDSKLTFNHMEKFYYYAPHSTMTHYPDTVSKSPSSSH